MSDAPLVLLHGFTGSPASWDGVVRALGAGARAVAVAIALPGHRAGPDVAAGWDANVDAIAADLRARGLAGAHITGYSLGARTALGLTARHPAIASRLTLIGVHPGLASDAERAARRAADARWIDLLRTAGLTAFVDAWEQHPVFATQASLPAGVRARQRAIRRSHDPAGLAASLEHMGLGAMPDLRAALADLAIPVRLVAGDRDAKFLGLARELHAAMPHIDLVVRRGGHNLVLEDPGLSRAIG